MKYIKQLLIKCQVHSRKIYFLFAVVAAALVLGASPATAQSNLLQPTNGQIRSSTFSLSWNNDGGTAVRWWVYFGSSKGTNDLWSYDAGTQTSIGVNWPNPPSQVWIRLWSGDRNNQWAFRDYLFTINVGGNVAISKNASGLEWASKLETISVGSIFANAQAHLNVRFTPTNAFTNVLLANRTKTYAKGSQYFGTPYSQTDPPTKAAMVERYVFGLSGNQTLKSSVGIDCSSFIADCWRLTFRPYTGSLDGCDRRMM